jgi:seryl-tRNA synthetase
MGDEAIRRLARRGYTLDLSAIESLQSRRNQSIRIAGELRSESKHVATEVQRAAKAGEDTTALKEKVTLPPFAGHFGCGVRRRGLAA